SALVAPPGRRRHLVGRLRRCRRAARAGGEAAASPPALAAHSEQPGGDEELGPSSDQIGRQIVELRGSMEPKIEQLRERGQRQVRRAVMVVAAGAAGGGLLLGGLVIYPLTRPATPGEPPRPGVAPGPWAGRGR